MALWERSPNQMRFYSNEGDLAFRRDFTVVDYAIGETGEWLPRRPAECRRRTVDGAPCRLRVNHWRARPTLSLGRVLVLECLVHGRAFTVYPITLAPYQRAPTAAATPSGQAVRQVSEESGGVSFKGTLFATAACFRDGQRYYSREPENRHGPRAVKDLLKWRGGAVRELERAEQLLGLEPELTDAERVERAAVLGVEALSLKQASVEGSRGDLSVRGAGCCALLEAMPPIASGVPGCRLERLLVAGYRAGLWGRPWIWESAAGGWRSIPREAAAFPGHGPERQRGSQSGSEPPTSLVGDGPEGLM